MSHIHVLHVLNSVSGGSALSTLQLIPKLREQGVQSSMICFQNGTPEEDAAIREVLQGRVLFRKLHWMNKRIRARGWKRPAVEALDWWQTWGGYRYLREFEAFTREQGVNLIHSSTLLNSEGMLLSQRLGLPHIIHGRELIGPDKAYRFYRFAQWRQRLQAHSQVLVANSQVTYENYLQYFPESYLRLIPNGIELGAFTLKRHIDQTPIVVAMVGNLTSRWKNHPRFVQLAMACLQENPEMEFRMYGSLPGKQTPEMELIQRIILDAGLEEKIRFMGHHPDPSAFLQEVDILCHTADKESFGRVYVEAMAAGLPVVAIAAGGALNIVEHKETGYLFEKNEDAVARIIQLAKDAPLRQRMGEAGRQRAEAEFSLNALTHRVITLYQSVLSEEI